MSQKMMDNFVLRRKRQRPEPSKGDDKEITDELDSSTHAAKKVKLGPPEHNEPVKYHQSRAEVVKSLKASVKDGGPLSSKQGCIGNSDLEYHGVSGLSKGPHDPNSNTQASGKPSNTGGFVTIAQIQRKLFVDDDVEKINNSAPKEKGVKEASSASKLVGMSPQKMKDSLKGCNKIQELKEKLAHFNAASARLKKFQADSKDFCLEKQDAGKASAIEFEILSPIKTPRKFVASPSPKKTPTFKRFQHLIRDAPVTLTLPYKYRFLKEAFHCLDTVASFLHNRKEIITFKKLKASVQEMLSKTFTETHLAQIRTVFPFAFFFRREKNLPNHKVTPNNKNKWQLTLEVNTNYASDLRTCAPDVAQPPSAHGEYRKLTPSMLLERGKIFHASLLDIVLQHHQEFLQLLDPPVMVDPTSITRWHPDFVLEAVPDVPAAPLPAPPADEVGGTAREVLERARGLFAKYPNLQQCLESVAGAEPKPEPAAGPSGAPPAAAATAPPAPTTSGLPAGLLERIRAREAARQRQLMTRSPAESRRLEMLGRLPQLVRSLRATFVAERRAALSLEAAVTRLADNSRSMLDADELVQHVELLAREAPAFVQIVQLKSGRFVKLSKDADVNAVARELEKKVEKV